MKHYFMFILILINLPLSAQSLFENAVEGTAKQSQLMEDKTYKLNGFMRGVFFGGKIPETEKAEMKSGYGEAALKLRVRKQSFGDGFAEIRFRRGTEFGKPVSEVNLREAYVNTYAGRFDLRIGHQIVVWGRADGFNPTNNITPQNMLVRSPDEDDRREGNFLIRSFYNLHPIRLEFIWVPVYTASVLPTQLIPLPRGITLGPMIMPTSDLENGSLALKLELALASLDGSVSYFRGFNPMPGITASIQGQDLLVNPRPYRVQVIGADASTVLGPLGVRGEFAYRRPEGKFETEFHIPNPDLQYILGLEKSWGEFSLIAQYIGRKVLEFTELEPPQSIMELMNHEIASKNRMIASQQHEISHAISVRPAWTLLHETLHIEFMGFYNFTTEEYLFRPKLSYDITDALMGTLGGEIYAGPNETLFGTIDETLSSLFIELKVSF